MSNNKPTWIPTVLLPWLVIVIVILGLCFWLQKSCLQQEVTLNNLTEYTLEGTEGWVRGRQWLVYETETKEPVATSDNEGVVLVADYPRATNLTLTHPDWSTKFLLANKPDSECEGDDLSEEFLAECAERHQQILKVDKNLDSWLENWKQNVLLGKWSALAEVTVIREMEGESDTELSKELSNRMNEWVESLASEGWELSGLDLYQNLDRLPRNDGREEVLLVWQLTNPQTGQKKLVTKGLNPYLDEQGEYRWDLTTEAFPN